MYLIVRNHGINIVIMIWHYRVVCSCGVDRAFFVELPKICKDILLDYIYVGTPKICVIPKSSVVDSNYIDYSRNSYVRSDW